MRDSPGHSSEELALSHLLPILSKFYVGPGREDPPPRVYVFVLAIPLRNHLIGGAYCRPPSETRAFAVPARSIRHPTIASEPLVPS